METDMLKIGIIGTGLMADIYASILKDRAECELVAVVGNSESTTNTFSNKYNIKGYPDSNYKKLYEEHPDINITIIACPEWIREEPVRVSVNNNQHILLEKPFAVGLDEANVLDSLLYKHSQSYVVEVCHVLRHSPRFYSMHNAVKRGDIGQIRHIYARRNSNLKRVNRVLGKTDLAFWLTPHDIDIMRWITGSEIVEVFARSKNKLKSEDDYLIANFRFENGVDAVLEISWCTPPLSGAAPEAIFEVWGTEGSIQLEDYNMNVKIFRSDERVSVPDTYEDYLINGHRRGFFEALVNDFIHKVKNNHTGPDSVHGGLETVKVCDMVRRSLDESRIISIK